MKRKIPQQEQIEKTYKMPFRQVMVDLYNLKGLRGAAAELGVPSSTLGYWMVRERIQIRHVAE